MSLQQENPKTPRDLRGRFRFPQAAKFHKPSSQKWSDPPSFGAALALHMRLHQDTYTSLYEALARPNDKTKALTIKGWMRGISKPRFGRSFNFLVRVERRYN